MKGSVAVLLVAFGVLAAGGVAEPVAAGHDSTGPDGHPINFTWTPYDLQGGPSNNHLPGLEGASHASFSTSENPGGFERLQFVVVRSEDVDFSDCSSQQTRAFGIDRGDDDPGTIVDEDLLDNYERSSFEPDRIVIDFYEDSDFAGDAPSINSSDQLVSAVANCFGNPDEPGWYRVHGKLNGTTWEGEEEALTPLSHYFYICECESEAEARETLGPPPSEQGGEGGGATATPTPTVTGTPADPDEGTTTPTATARAGTRTPTSSPGADGETPTPTRGGDATSPRGTPTAARPSATAGGSAPASPTLAEGPGFGPLLSLAALLAAGALACRSR